MWESMGAFVTYKLMITCYTVYIALIVGNPA